VWAKRKVKKSGYPDNQFTPVDITAMLGAKAVPRGLITPNQTIPIPRSPLREFTLYPPPEFRMGREYFRRCRSIPAEAFESRGGSRFRANARGLAAREEN